MAAAGAGGPVTTAADEAAMGADGHFEDGAEVGVAAAGGEGPAAATTAALLGRQVRCLSGGGEGVVVAAAVAGAAALLAAGASRHRVGGRLVVADRLAVLGEDVGEGVGVVVALAAAAVEAMFEQAHLGLEVGEPLLQLGLVLLDARRGSGLSLGVSVGKLFFELGFALAGTAVEGFVEAGLLTGEPKGLLAGGQAARGGGRDRVEDVGLHTSEYAKAADSRVGW